MTGRDLAQVLNLVRDAQELAPVGTVAGDKLFAVEKIVESWIVNGVPGTPAGRPIETLRLGLFLEGAQEVHAEVTLPAGMDLREAVEYVATAAILRAFGTRVAKAEAKAREILLDARLAREFIYSSGNGQDFQDWSKEKKEGR